MTAGFAEAWPVGRSYRPLFAIARGIRHGRLVITLPDGRDFAFEGAGEGPVARLVLRHARAVRRLVMGGTVGLAEAYMDGDWDTPDLAVFLELGLRNEAEFGDLHYGGRVVGALRWLWHALHANTRRGSRRNIAQHYDLGNGFYSRWLDPTMTYSSAIFADHAQDLSAAQLNKYRHIAELLDLRPEHRVLEIGCGWGGFADFVAREFGCRVTAITISREQLDFTQRRIQQQGLGDRVEARYVDYRDVQDRFDRIASIEMLEAVGEKYWPAFFGKIRDALVPGGRAALQVITIADCWFERYRRGADFIQRYIFPGGMLPSPGALEQAIGGAGLALATQRFFGHHYARTLATWQQRFEAAWPEIVPLGFDERFKRMWEFYLAYCEAGFKAGSIDVAQVALVRR